MKYLLLIQHGDTPTPGTEAWEQLSEDEQRAVYADYQALNNTPGVTPGVWMESPESATTVRVQAARAELLRRVERVDESRAAYRRALELVHTDTERRFLKRRLAEL